jgi:Zn-dependent protease with chaperone function
MTPCRYFDGSSSRPWPASVGTDGTALRIVGEHLDRSAEAHELDFSPATDRGPARIALTDGALCEIDDRAAAESLFATLGYRRPRADRLASRTSHAVAVTLAFVGVMAALYVWGVPFAADVAVRWAPRQWDQALGEQVMHAFDERRIFRPTTLSAERRNRLVQRFDALRLPGDGASTSLPVAPAELRLAFRQLGAPNAFALPGNRIVVTDEIVALAGDDDDALLTVLAHEVGHVEHRDAMRQLARGTLTSIVAAWYFGDVSNAVAAVAGGLGSMRYSRDAEHRADLYALQTMQINGIETQSAADLFRRLETWRPSRPLAKPTEAEVAEKGSAKEDDSVDARVREEAEHARKHFRIPEYLSTHPATEDRIRLFESGVVAKDGAAD